MARKVESLVVGTWIRFNDPVWDKSHKSVVEYKELSGTIVKDFFSLGKHLLYILLDDGKKIQRSKKTIEWNIIDYKYPDDYDYQIRQQSERERQALERVPNMYKSKTVKESPQFTNLQQNLNNIQSQLVQNSDLLGNLTNSLTSNNLSNIPNPTNSEMDRYNQAIQDFSEVADQNALHMQHTPFETETTTNMQIQSKDGTHVAIDKSGTPEIDISNNFQDAITDKNRDTLLASLSAILGNAAI